MADFNKIVVEMFGNFIPLINFSVTTFILVMGRKEERFEGIAEFITFQSSFGLFFLSLID